MSVAEQLTGRLHLAGDFLSNHEWTQGSEKRGDAYCATGAVRYCAPVDGDVYLIREVLRKRDRAEAWNDADGRTAVEVVSYLRTAVVTDADLLDTFGPQWEAVVALVRRAVTVTPEEAKALAAARGAARYAARGAARDAADTARDAAEDAARDAADTARDAADTARYAAEDAARALVVRDLIGAHGFTQAHYDTLAGPWAAVIGPVHPDDTKETAA